ncbi:MAG: hypothetical protein U0Y10_01440 [Spirosomataceae bacterium]
MVKELFSKNWDFTLYQVNDRLVISVVFFGLVDFYRSFRLLENDLRNDDYELLYNLSKEIRNNYDNYKYREIIPAITSESPPLAGYVSESSTDDE